MDQANVERGAALWSEMARRGAALTEFVAELAKSNPRLAELIADSRGAEKKYLSFAAVAEAFWWGEAA